VAFEGVVSAWPGALAAGALLCAGAVAAACGALAAAVACGVNAGGGAATAAGGAACDWLCAVTAAISAGSFCAMPDAPASEASGAGPMAAPATMPTPSMTLASSALARAEGSRVLPARGGEPGAAGGRWSFVVVFVVVSICV
jgi:hypothetical protein